MTDRTACPCSEVPRPGWPLLRGPLSGPVLDGSASPPARGCRGAGIARRRHPGCPSQSPGPRRVPGLRSSSTAGFHRRRVRTRQYGNQSHRRRTGRHRMSSPQIAVMRYRPVARGSSRDDFIVFAADRFSPAGSVLVGPRSASSGAVPSSAGHRTSRSTATGTTAPALESPPPVERIPVGGVAAGTDCPPTARTEAAFPTPVRWSSALAHGSFPFRIAIGTGDFAMCGREAGRPPSPRRGFASATGIPFRVDHAVHSMPAPVLREPVDPMDAVSPPGRALGRSGPARWEGRGKTLPERYSDVSFRSSACDSRAAFTADSISASRPSRTISSRASVETI